MFMGPCIVRYESHIRNQQDATFFKCSLLIATLYMFQASLAHCQELRNCVCSLWYWHVDLCNDGSTVFWSMGLWVMWYNILWMFISCGLRDLVPLVGNLLV